MKTTLDLERIKEWAEREKQGDVVLALKVSSYLELVAKIERLQELERGIKYVTNMGSRV